MVWYLAKIGLAIQIIGFVFILWSQRKKADQYSRELMFALALIALGVGSLLSISATIIPGVEGTFIARQNHFKGSADDIVVRTSDGKDRMVDANLDRQSDCTMGNQIVKPAFSMEFTCNGKTLAPKKITYYVGIFAASILTMLGIFFFIRCQKLLLKFN